MTEPIAVRVSDEIRGRLLERAGSDRPLSEILREAVFAYLGDPPPGPAPAPAPAPSTDAAAVKLALFLATQGIKEAPLVHERLLDTASVDDSGRLLLDGVEAERALPGLVPLNLQPARGGGGSGGGSPREARTPIPKSGLPAELLSQEAYNRSRAELGGDAVRLQARIQRELSVGGGER